MLRSDGGDMCMVVLDRHGGQSMFLGERRGKSRAEEIRMQVVRNGVGCHVEYRAKMINGFEQRFAGRRIVEIADVRRKKRLVAARYAHRIFQIGTGRED